MSSTSFSSSSPAVFEKRGVKLLLIQKLRDLALGKNPNANFWSIGAVSAHINGNHEILSAGNRWGNIDCTETLTYGDQCSLIELLRRKHSDGNPHPVLDLTYQQVVGDCATIFLSFAYSSNFIEMTTSLESHLETNQDGMSAESSFIWFDVVRAPFVLI